MCISQILTTFAPQAVKLSSGNDTELVMATATVCKERGLRFDALDGAMNEPLNIDFMIRHTGLPLKIDPKWLNYLKSWFWRFFCRSASLMYEPYWNLQLCSNADAYPIKLNRLVAVMASVHLKFSKTIFRTGRDASSYYELWDDEVKPEILTEKIWREHFSDDEMVLISQLLGTFMKEFPSSAMDRAGMMIKTFLKERSVRSVLLMHDKQDSCRLLAWAAHSLGLQVDYLPHGIIFEDASGRASPTPFSPDRILSWNQDSADAFKKYGWRAESVAHPHFQKPALPFKRLERDKTNMKVLILLADWVYLTEVGREDCTWVWYREIVDALNTMGIRAENVCVKLHQLPTDSASHYLSLIAQIDSLFDYKPRLVAHTKRLQDLIKDFDLVIGGLTTGIYECALHGVPFVLYGMSAKRVQLLSKLEIPHAKDTRELMSTITEYDNEAGSQVSAALISSLRSGRDILEVSSNYR